MWPKSSHLKKKINIGKRAFLSFYFFCFGGVLVFTVTKTNNFQVKKNQNADPHMEGFLWQMSLSYMYIHKY